MNDKVTINILGFKVCKIKEKFLYKVFRFVMLINLISTIVSMYNGNWLVPICFLLLLILLQLLKMNGDI